MTTDASSNRRPACASVRPGAYSGPRCTPGDDAVVEHLGSKSLLAAFDQAWAQAAVMMATAYLAGDTWVDAVRGALQELLAFLDDRPSVARLLVVDSLGGDAGLRARRDDVLAKLARALEADRPVLAASSLPAPFGGEAVVGAVAAILHGRLVEDPVPSLRDLGGPLMGLIVLPYLDVAAARGELSRQTPDG